MYLHHSSPVLNLLRFLFFVASARMAYKSAVRIEAVGGKRLTAEFLLLTAVKPIPSSDFEPSVNISPVFCSVLKNILCSVLMV